MKLITKEIEKKFEEFPLYSQDGKGLNAEVLVKFFNPTGVGTWYITEANKLEDGDYEMFGYCHLGDDENAEFGNVLLSDLEDIKLPYGLKIERDMYLKNGINLENALKRDGIKMPDFLMNDETKKDWEIRVPTGETLMEFDTINEAKKQVVKYIIDDLLSKDEENNTKYKINFYSIYDTETNNEIIKDNRILNLNYLTDTINKVNSNNFRNFKEFLNAEKEDNIQDTIYACCKDSADIYYDNIFNWAKDNTGVINEYIDEMGGFNGKGFDDICNLIQQSQIRENEQHYFDNLDGLILIYALNYVKENNIDINEYDLDESLNMIANNANNFSKFEEITNLIDGKYKNLENEGEEL
jgi:hypothetical protein